MGCGSSNSAKNSGRHTSAVEDKARARREETEIQRQRIVLQKENELIDEGMKQLEDEIATENNKVRQLLYFSQPSIVGRL